MQRASIFLSFVCFVCFTDNTTHPAHYLKVSASDDGSFAVFNSRTNETRGYPARR